MKHYFTTFIILLLLASSSTNALAINANGNSVTDPTKAEPDSVYHLKSLEVVGFRRDKVSKINVEMKHLPFRISKISLSPLKLRGVFDFQEAVRFTPAAHVSTSYGAFQQLSVRGFDYTPIEIDGMRDERTTFNSYPVPDLTMVETLEVTKGPASILSGHSSVGGAINIVRKSATNVPTLELLLMGGSWNTYQVSGTIGGKVVDGINTLFNLNVAGGDGWRDRGDKRFSLYNNTNFRLAPNHVLDLRLSYVHDYYGTEAGLPATMPADITDEAAGKVIYREGDLLRGLNLAQRYNTESDFMYNTNANGMLRYVFYHCCPGKFF